MSATTAGTTADAADEAVTRLGVNSVNHDNEAAPTEALAVANSNEIEGVSKQTIEDKYGKFLPTADECSWVESLDLGFEGSVVALLAISKAVSSTETAVCLLLLCTCVFCSLTNNWCALSCTCNCRDLQRYLMILRIGPKCQTTTSL